MNKGMLLRNLSRDRGDTRFLELVVPDERAGAGPR